MMKTIEPTYGQQHTIDMKLGHPKPLEHDASSCTRLNNTLTHILDTTQLAAASLTCPAVT